MLYIHNNKLIREFNGEIMQIEAFHKDSFRVRVTQLDKIQNEDWALMPQDEVIPTIEIAGKNYEKEKPKVNAEEAIVDDTAIMTNGKIKVIVNKSGKIVFLNDKGKNILEEYEYNTHTSLGINSRELKTLSGGLFKASLKFNSNPNERIYGMGQYQNGIFNLKGTFLELAQRNSQASVPFMYSSLGYGFLWNNPAVGKANFGINMTEWEANCTKQIDFWITVGDKPKDVIKNYTDVTGNAPVMPDYALGFWQSKLRYQTQEELLNVAREYKKRNVPLDVIVADFFHWTLEGTWEFDKQYWPDPKAMVDELKEMQTELVVSVWPTVSIKADNYEQMKNKGYLIRSSKGVNINMLAFDPTSFTDVTNPKARDYMWNKIKKNYYDYGIKSFWLDVAEPEYSSYDFENYRYYKGTASEVGNEYPVYYSKTFYDGLMNEGEKDNIINLVRCAWAGSQKYGALVWSGDIPSTFECFKKQIVCGLQMSVAGIPWWTTDIGGFHDGNVNDDKFKELLIRWFQYGAFCPVMRLHGAREPFGLPMSTVGGGRCGSGADNEIWSYGEENYEIMKRYIQIRNKLKPYIRYIADKSTQTGSPIMRPLFYDYPNDYKVWEISDQFMFGEAILVAPVTNYNEQERKVYLPLGTKWINAFTSKEYDGGQTLVCDAPIDTIPVFLKADRPDLLDCFK